MGAGACRCLFKMAVHGPNFYSAVQLTLTKEKWPVKHVCLRAGAAPRKEWFLIQYSFFFHERFGRLQELLAPGRDLGAEIVYPARFPQGGCSATVGSTVVIYTSWLSESGGLFVFNVFNGFKY